MKEFIKYIIEALLCGGAFMLLYHLVIAKYSSFLTARRYLLGTAVLTLIIPLLNIPLFPAKKVYLSSVPSILMDSFAMESEVGVAQTALSGEQIVMYLYTALYLAVIAVMLGLMVREMIKISRLKRDATPLEGRTYKVYQSAAIKSSFSYMRSIFLNSCLPESEHEAILVHEESHLKHNHPIEKGVMSLLRILQWYNPFVWLGHRYLSEIHEYQADSEVITQGYDITEYRTLILKQTIGYSPDIITCGFNNSLTKKRFIMMTKKRQIGRISLRVSSTLVVTAGLMLLFSFTRMPTEYLDAEGVEQTEQQPQQEQKKDKKEIQVLSGSISKVMGADGELLANKNMLFIVDGKVFDGDLDTELKLDNVASISVLKNEAAKKIAKEQYGVDLGDKEGVVVISSKTDSESGGVCRIEQSDKKSSIRVQGVGKMSPNDIAIYVVDGKVVEGDLDKELDPSNIASISVLKNEAAKKIAKEQHGIDIGDNEGVVVITSKTDSEGDGAVRIEKGDKKSSIRVQGVGKMSPNDKTIYIVDGKVVEGDLEKNLDPSNIASISVLKGKMAQITIKEQHGIDIGDNEGVVVITSKTDSERSDGKVSKFTIVYGDKAIEKGDKKSSIRVKGVGKMSTNKVIYIVDGKVVEGDVINGLVSDNIASISVLKNEAAKKRAKEQYGIDLGDNEDVIVITSKTPSK